MSASELKAFSSSSRLCRDSFVFVVLDVIVLVERAFLSGEINPRLGDDEAAEGSLSPCAMRR